MYRASDMLDAVPLIWADERERIAAGTINSDQLRQAVARLAEITGNRDSYHPALAGDIFRYAQGEHEAT